MNSINLKNKKFGKLKVLEENGRNKKGSIIWVCKCDCGKIKKINGEYLRYGITKSCGCLHKKIVTTHGMWGERIYMIWNGIKQRTGNKDKKGYKNWGGRGIKVCKRWLKFENFRDDMYESYLEHCRKFGEKNTQIDRINNNGNYELSNCRWVTRKENNRNTSRNRMITINNETYPLVVWAEKLKISADKLRGRIRLGWDENKLLNCK